VREIAHCPLSREIQPTKIKNKSKFKKLSLVWQVLRENLLAFLAQGGICFRGAQFLVTEQNWVGLLSTVSPPGGACEGLYENWRILLVQSVLKNSANKQWYRDIVSNATGEN